MRSLLASIAALVLLAGVPSAASAATCQPGLLDQSDLAGTYVSFESALQVTIYPCGGLDVLWSNDYGTHRALYLGQERFGDGSIRAALYQPDPYVRSLDGRN